MQEEWWEREAPRRCLGPARPDTAEAGGGGSVWNDDVFDEPRSPHDARLLPLRELAPRLARAVRARRHDPLDLRFAGKRHACFLHGGEACEAAGRTASLLR